MSNFRQQLFHQFASQGLATSIDAFKTQYQPKKENRFNIDGITYEIGPARLDGDSITFEISSKIPRMNWMTGKILTRISVPFRIS